MRFCLVCKFKLRFPGFVAMKFVQSYIFEKSYTVLSYFSITMMKDHDQVSYKTKHLIRGLLAVSENVSVSVMVDSMVRSRHAWHWRSSWEPTLRPASQRERENKLELVWPFATSKPTPQWHTTPQIRPLLLIFLKMIPPTGDPSFQYRSVRGPVLFKSPHTTHTKSKGLRRF